MTPALAMRTPCPDETELVLLAEGAVSDLERAKLEGHLDACVACSQVLAAIAELTTSARKAPDRYRLIRQLGAGAMGVVWEAEDTQLSRRVALKWVTPTASGDREYRTRLFREARALAQLHHPNVMAVHDVGEVGDELYLALELIVGTTAREWLEARPRSAAESLAVWRQAGAGLAAIHKAGIVHRDIKPENVFVATDGRVVIGDFGLATGDLGQTTMNLTATGAVIGTPLYMPVEQLGGEVATAKGDQFSLCVCLWESLAGKRPFQANTMASLALAMLKPPEIPAGCDRRIFTVLQRGLATEPGERWPDVTALLEALEQPAEEKPEKPRRSRTMMFAAAALVLGGAGVLAVHQLTTTPSPAPAPVTPTPDTVAVATPIAPPKPPPAKALSAGEHVDAAAVALAVRDAKTCLAELAAAGTLSADLRESADLTRASCLMLSGDCVAGHAEIERVGQARRWDPAKLARATVDRDAKWCPLDAPPTSAWPVRAAKRLEAAAYAHQSCTAILDFIATNRIVLPRDPMDPGQSNQRVFCMVSDGKCTEARALFMKMRAQGATGNLREIANHSFDLSFPSCAGN